MMMFSPVLVTPPVTTPVTLEEARNHLRVDTYDQDDLITSLLEAATAHLDGCFGILGRGLVTQTWRQDFDSFDDELRLPLGPVTSVTSVKYYDGDDVQQTLSPSTYGFLTDQNGAYVALLAGQSWPAIYNRSAAVSVAFVVGSADSAVPAPLKTAILMLVGHWYANREAVSGESMTEVPLAVDALIRPYRQINL